MDTEIYSIINTFVTVFLGGGWFLHWRGKPVSLVTFGGHGGSQAQIAMKLVVTGLKMAALPVDLQINLLPDDSTATADRKLNTYNTQAALLKTAFENELS